jgi:hypothetical protein
MTTLAISKKLNIKEYFWYFCLNSMIFANLGYLFTFASLACELQVFILICMRTFASPACDYRE